MVDLLKPMQRFVANASITPSAVRQGRHAVKGVQRAAIAFLRDLDIAELAHPDSFPEVIAHPGRQQVW
jgi:hypothetical protein